MRPFEMGLFIVCLTGSLYLFAVNAPKRGVVLRVAWPVLFLLAFAGHAAAEGLRWQMYPLYLGALILAVASLLNSGPRPALGRWGGFAFTLLLVLAAGFLSSSLPVFRLPAVSKPLGTFSLFLTDTSREEYYAATPGGPRQFMVQVWYPADAASVAGSTPAPWSREISAIGSELAKGEGLPTFLLEHLDYVKSNAYTDAAPEGPAEKRLPVVLYSHGWTGFRTIAASECERIAAAGFIVIAPDHTYGSAGTVFPDGKVMLNNPKAMPEKNDPERQAGIEKLVDSYVGDLRFLLNTLPRLDSGEEASPLKGRIDLARIGVFGHSTGGGAAVELAKSDERIKAIAGLDIWGEPVSPEFRALPRPIPVASIRSQDWHDTRTVDRDMLHQFLDTFGEPKYDLYLEGSRHGDFTVVPIISPLMQMLVPHQRGTTPAAAALDSVDGFLAAFFLQSLVPDSGVSLPAAPATSHPLLKQAKH
jgi:hypothetical protein